MKNKTINTDIDKMIIVDSGYMPDMVNSLKNMMSIEELKFTF